MHEEVVEVIDRLEAFVNPAALSSPALRLQTAIRRIANAGLPEEMVVKLVRRVQGRIGKSAVLLGIADCDREMVHSKRQGEDLDFIYADLRSALSRETGDKSQHILPDIYQGLP